MKYSEKELKEIEAQIISQNPPDRIVKNHPSVQQIETSLSNEIVVWDRHEKRYYPKKEKSGE